MTSLLLAKDLKLPGRIQADAFQLAEGECLVLCGPNGSGKSSLLRTLAGLESEYEGKVCLGGEDIRQMSRLSLAARLAWLPQRPHLVEPITCEAIVAAARYRFSEPSAVALEQARQALDKQEIGHLATRLATHVSGGELQRVLIASLMAQNVPFLMVDEPANHLDPAHQLSTYRKLGELWQQGKGVLIVSHDVRLARLLGDPERVRIAFVKEGHLVGECRLSDPDLSSQLSEIYGVEFIPQSDPAALAVRF